MTKKERFNFDNFDNFDNFNNFDNDEEIGYYNLRCKKGHYECVRISLKYCEDFEKGLEE